MSFAPKTLWINFVRPLFRRPDQVQIAALCYRMRGSETEVLLVSSRERRRWIIPKGWPIAGMTASEAAIQEAWEEAGVVRARSTASLGRFGYVKKLEHGLTARVSTKVFALHVEELSDDFPEAKERQRIWVTPNAAAEMVEEPELRRILDEFRAP